MIKSVLRKEDHFVPLWYDHVIGSPCIILYRSLLRADALTRQARPPAEALSWMTPDILALKNFSRILGHCNNPALLFSHF